MVRLLVIAMIAGCTASTAEPKPVAPPVEAHFIRTPLVRQTTEYTCGVAALQSVLLYYGVPDEQESELAKVLGSTSDAGTNYRAIVSYAQELGFAVSAKSRMTVAELEVSIDAKRPVILALQAWAEDASIDWRKSDDNGHYVVATGYDTKNLYFMDPSTRGRYTFIPRAQLEARWHDFDAEAGELDHFGIVISGRAPAFDSERAVAMP